MASEQRLAGSGHDFDELFVLCKSVHIERNHDGAIYISIAPESGEGRFLLDVEASNRNKLWVGVTEKPSGWEGEERDE